MDERLRRQVYRILLVVTAAMMTGRVASTERVYEPSLHRPDPKMAAGAILVPFAAANGWESVALLGGGHRSLVNVEGDAPSRMWPTQRPHPMPTFSSNDRSRWATIRALVEDGTFCIGRRAPLPNQKYVDYGRIFEPGYESVDKVKDPTTDRFYSSKPPLLTTLLAGEYWILYKLGFTLETHRWFVVRFMVWTQNVLPLILFLGMFAAVIEKYGRSDWGRLFCYAAACFGSFLGTFGIALNNHVPAAVAAFLAVYPLLMSPISPRSLLFCGLFAGLAFAFELTAAALTGGLLVGLLYRDAGKTLAFYLPAAVVPTLAQAGLNYAAIGDPLPVYMKFGAAGKADWYQYEGSHWRKREGEVKRGIDWAGDYEPRGVYATHLLVGHHGIFSLTPLWLLSWIAMISVGWRHLRDPGRIFDNLLTLTLLVSLANVAFYSAIVGTVNYSGWSSCARWFLWLAPLWLLALMPAADWLSRRRSGRALALVCLALSVFSASYPAWNPWRHPWIYNLLETYGFIPYGK